MTELLTDAAEKWFGIKTEPDDVAKLGTYLVNTYGGVRPEIIDRVFSSGEAAGFLTVGETYFFREPAHFEFLKDLLPLYEKPGIRICSAATAAGCEAYSIAMLIEGYNKITERPVSYKIDAFDINPLVIETACKGVYSSRTLREDGSSFHYLTNVYLKKTGNGYAVDPSLKKNICFFVHNLMNALPSADYDIVFFRNAFIYFSPHSRKRALSNLSESLKEGGFLIVGVSETAGVNHAELEGKNRNDVFYFQRRI